ncbi:rhamnogalacturonan acetylesterase [Bacillus horti]|uniref:Lysophospholipase L1-like esterase n=1 Tax=Caldalkalibacillus horti TaxID=77523 RepID=A0ABT9VVQ4_9BACI|nr:rhamnogalacturonan acetylesterase [Bacillus horti]MDQ0164959.1 lysophospholipase L1-like esterase [Bacillus horti]
MKKVNIYLAGDSTVSYYDTSYYPRSGWGQLLGNLMNEHVHVHNKASSGRSTKSFIEEGRLLEIEGRLVTGDYLFIQFGHNDAKPDTERRTEPFTTYKEYLLKYIEVAKRKGAFPVLFTPVQRRSFNQEGELQATHGEYPNAMKQLAQETKTPLIDLGAKSERLLQDLGTEKAKELYLWLKPDAHANYPSGIQDDTHFSEYGALEMAKLVVEGLLELDLPLSQYVIK